MPYFDAVKDPLEGLNRCTWNFNVALFRGVLYPVSLGYNQIPEVARNKISNAGHNLTYPVRLVNNCLQGKWHGAWEETKRFGVNSTVGVAGLFDPATRWHIGRSDEDFGQTMGTWGSGPGFYLVIPVVGPSNGRDALGRIVDWPLDIAFWIGRAYPDDLWAQAIRPGLEFNDLSGQAPAYKRQLDSQVDPYLLLRTLYSLNRERLILDYVPSYEPGVRPDPTIGAVLFKPVTPHFAEKATTRRVTIPATGKELAYSCWMQKKPAPLVCYIPGLGSYRLDNSSLAYADLMYRNGYSVVAISNPFQKEFMEHASTMAVPGFGPTDCDEALYALEAILADVSKWRGDKITGVSLTGVSHGAYLTLMIAEREAEGKLGSLAFDRYVAVDPPASLPHTLKVLDELYLTPLRWPANERSERIKVALYKALYFADSSLNLSGNIPLTEDESRFLIGLVFRYTLMNAIVDSQRREDLGVLKNDPKRFVRQKSYDEIRQISYQDYVNRFLLPYVLKTGLGTNRQQLMASAELMHYTEALKNNPKIRVQISEDDLLLTPEYIAWFRATFGDKLLSYRTGGHLGNLHDPAVQRALVRLFPLQSP